MSVTIEVQKRSEGSKPRALRRAGLIPAVLYGHSGTESVSLTINVKTAERLLKEADINNTLIDLSIPEISWSGQTLLREVQSHPWKGYTYHLSFFAVAAHGALEVEVPIHFVGESIGVKQDGGIIDILKNQLQVKCLPDSIPESINIDISGLKVGDSLHVSDLALPAGVVAADEPGITIAIVLQPRGGAEAKEA
jgi:large subunit ribosomal protein L25